VNAAAGNSDAPQGDSRLRYVLRIADTSLVLAQRLGAWVGHAPAIEEDLGLANTALDLLGQARLFLSYAGELEGRGRSEDDLAFLRDEPDILNATLAEMPNGDFGDTIVRQFLVDAYQVELYERLAASTDARLAEIAAKAVKEARYHVRYSASWLVRLGDGTDESHARVLRRRRGRPRRRSRRRGSGSCRAARCLVEPCRRRARRGDVGPSQGLGIPVVRQTGAPQRAPWAPVV
jgi:1,2-phenylacetyl-CoA epoxidase catalytic subunit